MTLRPTLFVCVFSTLLVDRGGGGEPVGLALEGLPAPTAFQAKRASHTYEMVEFVKKLKLNFSRKRNNIIPNGLPLFMRLRL